MKKKMMMGFTSEDVYSLQGRLLVFTSLNLLVRCVIVKDGKNFGEGFNPKAGNLMLRSTVSNLYELPNWDSERINVEASGLQV
ncbi:hypothetical protein Fmac_031954 [Flemingia macrophylla]|uniref:Uncharacterized protein n=1 Tax=Flemingia macrophylla TaxID=520843 RepID=A0ABD1L3Y6_9FABA